MIQACDNYLGARTGNYEFRRTRYLMALNALKEAGLNHSSTIMDVGAGWTEFDYCLRVDGGLRCRYIPVDGGIDGVNLEVWSPPRLVNYFVCLEVIEHLRRPTILLLNMQMSTKPGGAVVVSTPNPETVDVLAIDATHKTPVSRGFLTALGFDVEVTSLFGKPNDSLFAVWKNTYEPTEPEPEEELRVGSRLWFMGDREI